MITLAFIALLFNLFYASLLNGYRKQWSLIRLSNATDYSNLPFATLVIPFRNEAENLPKIVRCIAALNYPQEKLSIVFVNDNSTDEFEKVIRNANCSFNIQLINSDGEGKKAALTTGIMPANTEWIITTDADVEFDSDWITKLFSVKNIDEIEMICGRVLVRSNEVNASWMAQFQEMEFDMMQACGIAALELHQPLLNSGANLAFRKKSWLELGGYEEHSAISSGDDTFLMFAMHKRYGDVIIANAGAKVRTSVARDFKTFLHQRRRWAMKSRYYKNRYIQTTGAIVLFSSILLPVLYFGIAIPEVMMILATSVFIRLVSEIRLVNKITELDGNAYRFGQLLRMSLLYPFYLFFLTVTAPFNKTEWKGREL